MSLPVVEAVAVAADRKCKAAQALSFRSYRVAVLSMSRQKYVGRTTSRFIHPVPLREIPINKLHGTQKPPYLLIRLFLTWMGMELPLFLPAREHISTLMLMDFSKTRLG